MLTKGLKGIFDRAISELVKYELQSNTVLKSPTHQFQNSQTHKLYYERRKIIF